MFLAADEFSIIMMLIYLIFCILPAILVGILCLSFQGFCYISSASLFAFCFSSCLHIVLIFTSSSRAASSTGLLVQMILLYAQLQVQLKNELIVIGRTHPFVFFVFLMLFDAFGLNFSMV